MYYLYVARIIKDNLLYIGITKDIKKRMLSHNNQENIATKGHAPYKLIFFMGFPDKFKATSFEKYLKTALGKAFLRKRLL